MNTQRKDPEHLPVDIRLTAIGPASSDLARWAPRFRLKVTECEYELSPPPPGAAGDGRPCTIIEGDGVPYEIKALIENEWREVERGLMVGSSLQIRQGGKIICNVIWTALQE
ncbi:hypothetical protein ACQPZP_10710 [Spirillospora sp. CA-142024]|uniref:hypothetical protein n=1 Tax=Spirillospora sp. CA-142024 TaxID=3240036 RepID=UPI003D8B5C7A